MLSANGTPIPDKPIGCQLRSKFEEDEYDGEALRDEGFMMFRSPIENVDFVKVGVRSGYTPGWRPSLLVARDLAAAFKAMPVVTQEIPPPPLFFIISGCCHLIFRNLLYEFNTCISFNESPFSNLF